MADKSHSAAVSKDPERLFHKLEQQVSTYLDDPQSKQLRRAFEFARKWHEGQVRKSGEPFIDHPLEVARILADLRMDTDTLCAALLHDTVEDSSVTLEEVSDAFGPSVAELVDGVTKITQVEVESLTDEQAETLRKMFVAMSKDIRVIVIKLADRLHNMRTLDALREDRRIFKARETMEIYAPLAHRLGISSIKWELEDLSFYYLEPSKYHLISKMVAESREARENYMDRCISELSAELDKLKIKARIQGRPKHLYSIYQKMTTRGKDFSEIYDLIALRVIVDSIKDCYASLGAAHSLWHPMPGRFKDYIAMPKFNMYQSLHTTVIGPAARPLEIQIRTQEMHRMSEYGVAAHWRYKEGKADSSEAAFDQQLAWLREMLDWQSDNEDSSQFMKDLRTDLFESEIFVFTPKGEVKSLRAGATPIDFAYAIHTEVGNRCVGAKVNGSIVPLTSELHQGDRVEILTQKGARPSRDWLGIVKTPGARHKIRAYFAKANRGDDIQRGHDELASQMRKHGLGISSASASKATAQVASDLNYNSTDDMLAAIGSGKLSSKLASNRLLKALVKEPKPQSSGDALDSIAHLRPPRSKRKRPGSNGVVVKGLDDVLVRLSRCCNPVPGDEIVGFVTRGRGVTVHRADCPNAKKLMESPERIITVEWTDASSSSYQIEVLVEATDRLRLLQDVTIALTDSGVNVLSSNTQSHKDGLVEMRFLFELTETARLNTILNQIKGVEGVFEARRMMQGEESRKRAR